tara:strand:+ start:5192 stop:5371 length:180 start_codon:yes stop_codon:yes gene_type:complete
MTISKEIANDIITKIDKDQPEIIVAGRSIRKPAIKTKGSGEIFRIPADTAITHLNRIKI